MNRRSILAAFGAVLALPFAPAVAADSQEPVYGSQFMTPQERDEHRDRMRAATTAEERERIRADHHERMKERAAARGVTLPDPLPPGVRGMGPGGGMGARGGWSPGGVPGSGTGPGGGPASR